MICAACLHWSSERMSMNTIICHYCVHGFQDYLGAIRSRQLSVSAAPSLPHHDYFSRHLFFFMILAMLSLPYPLSLALHTEFWCQKDWRWRLNRKFDYLLEDAAIFSSLVNCALLKSQFVWYTIRMRIICCIHTCAHLPFLPECSRRVNSRSFLPILPNSIRNGILVY